MSFDKRTRNRLARVVAQCRARLAEDVTDQLQSTYGLHPDGTVLDVARTEDDRRAAEDLVALWAHFEAGEAGPTSDRREAAYQRMVREIGFTTLNRLAALRLCEERGLVLECVRKGMGAEGFQLYERIAGGALGNRYQTYRAFLESLFGELALDLGVLFDRTIPHSQVFPNEAALTDVLELLNDPELAARQAWQQDETIGWIYQYYNDPAERKAMRDASTAPRNSRELAVRNQFFTPRYVVEFLTDNTLGRIWYEMRRGDTRLVEQCNYLVHRPNEIFLRPGEETPEDGKESEDLSQEELLRQPMYIPYRSKKDPRELKILDPACGSGHFLLYAFDLLTTIYEEAWVDSDMPPFSETGTWLLHDYLSREELRSAIPGLILRYNLHGIDIDSRAVQIAALALWLRVQRAYQDRGLAPVERPRIARTNLVTAEPMPGDRELLREFIHNLRPRVLGDLVRVVFEKMELAGEAGSLLKIEDELAEAVADAHRQWAAGPQAEQMLLFSDDRRPKPEQRLQYDVSGITDAAFWETAEDQVLHALRDYATRVENGKVTRRRLFAEDAAQGFAFLALCQQSYDVVLMNPPFGEPPKSISPMLAAHFPSTKNDLFATFCERLMKLLQTEGLIGEISSRVGFFTKSFVLWRKDILGSVRIDSLVDLGMGVLDDATVEAACYVLDKRGNKARVPTLVIRLLIEDDKENALLDTLCDLDDSRCYGARFREYDQLPLAPFTYWVPQSILELLASHPTLEPAAAVVRQGLGTGDNPRFMRAIWEIPADQIGGILAQTVDGLRKQFSQDKRWAFHVRAGESQPWYSPLTLVIDWAKQGVQLKERWRMKGETPSRYVPSEGLYFRPGISWTRRAFRFIPYVIPLGCIPSASRYMAFPKVGSEVKVLGLCASNVATAFLRFYGEMFERPNHLVDTVKRLPFTDLDSDTSDSLRELITTEVGQRRAFYRNYEPFVDFTLPAKIKQWVGVHESNWNPYSLLGTALELRVAKSYGLSEIQLDELEFDLKEAIQVRRRATGSGKAEKQTADVSGDSSSYGH